MPNIIECDAVIQAGHQNTPGDGMTGGEGAWGNEIDWTPIVADTAVAALMAAGVNAVKSDASIKATDQHYRCRLAVFLHFDAAPEGAGESGPSVGYPDEPAVCADMAAQWKALYAPYWPFPEVWQNDNFTRNLHHYYGYRYVETTLGALLIEFGDLTVERQALWMRPRLEWLGLLTAHFVSARLGSGDILAPSPFP